MRVFSRWLLVIILMNTGAPGVFAQDDTMIIDVTARCQQGEAYQCHGACTDGWEVSCYYDTTQQAVKSGVSLFDQKDKCYAFYESSVCLPCRHIYSIEGKKTTCEEFYNAINAMNQKCGGCLKQVFRAGG